MINIKKFEKELWDSADILRANSKLTAYQYCMPVLGLIFLRYAYYSRYKMVEAEILRERPSRRGRVIPVETSDFTAKSTLYLPHDWDEQANYLPNGHGYDYTFLIRMNPFCEDVMRRNRFLYSDSIKEAILKRIIMAESWAFDIPGYVTREDLIQIINENYILPRGSMLNGKTRMDASNYYIQSGDMRNLNSFIRDRG